MGNPVKLRTKVKKIAEFGRDTYDVWLEPLGRKPKFKAGQFLHLALDDFDPSGGFWPESRVFSIASSPDEDCIRIIFSVKGSFTSRMRKEIIAEKEIWVKLPYGTFIIDELSSINKDIVLVAGGTGISPYLAWLAKLKENSCHVTLHYGVRQNSFIIPGLSIASWIDTKLYVEDEEPKESIVPVDKSYRGRLSIEKIFAQPHDGIHSVYFLSGPPQMIKNFSSGLSKCGVPSENIRIDEWE